MVKETELTLFGGDKEWNASDWTASDDRVRGGKSQSYLEISKSGARFHGNLDIKTLGGAGFASQRTTSEDTIWDLSDYDGVRLSLGKSDGKRYTFIVKDELLVRNPENGREQATISYEYDFELKEDSALKESTFIFIPWEKFTPTYRGKEKKDAKDLDRKNVKRFSIMMRSFFGDQEGDFSISIKSIKAVSLPDDEEAGFVGEKDGSIPHSCAGDNGRRRFPNASTLTAVFTLGIATYALCLFLCPSINGRQIMRFLHW